MADLRWRLHHLWLWAREKPYVWWNLILLASTLLLLFTPLPLVDGKHSDSRIRIWGLLLQMLGVLTVWKDLTSNATAFGFQSLSRNFVDWLSRAWPRRRVHAAAGVVEGGDSLVSASATVGWTLDGSQPVEERVRRLEANLISLERKFDQRTALTEARHLELVQRIDQEKQSREALANDMSSKLKEAVVGNFGILAFGIFWLAVGSVLTSISPEIVLIRQGKWTELLAAVWT